MAQSSVNLYTQPCCIEKRCTYNYLLSGLSRLSSFKRRRIAFHNVIHLSLRTIIVFGYGPEKIPQQLAVNKNAIKTANMSSAL